MDSFRLKRVIRRLKELRGAGTSVITLLLPPGEQICRITAMLGEEQGTASNIKSRVTRQSVLDALASLQSKLRLYLQVPENGLVLLCGIVEVEGKEKRLCLDFEPPRVINRYLYRCDNRFHLEEIEKSLEEDCSPISYIILTGSGYTLYTVIGTEIIKNCHEAVDLPRKHNKGGQSQRRFERLGESARHNYLTKVTEAIIRTYRGANMAPLVIAGSGSMKNKLAERLPKDFTITRLVDIQYDGDQGLREALTACSDLTDSLQVKADRENLDRLFTALSTGNDEKVAYGQADTMYALQGGYLEKLLIHEEAVDDDELDRLTDMCKDNSTDIAFVSNFTPASKQFLNGFAGLAGFLRYPVALPSSFDDPDV